MNNERVLEEQRRELRVAHDWLSALLLRDPPPESGAMMIMAGTRLAAIIVSSTGARRLM